jgi:hypothetical protein
MWFASSICCRSGFLHRDDKFMLKYFQLNSNYTYLISKQEISEYAVELVKSFMIELLEFIISARKSVLVLPKRNQIIFGGCPLKFDKSKKSASNVTIVKLFCILPYFNI